jgi:hypothetical protein
VVDFAGGNPRSRYLSGLHERPVAVRNQVSVLGTKKRLAMRLTLQRSKDG